MKWLQAYLRPKNTPLLFKELNVIKNNWLLAICHNQNNYFSSFQALHVCSVA
jgi:hypothetical protein